MSTPESSPPGSEETRLDASASGQARIYQAGRDQHIVERDLHLHYEDGVRRARRAELDDTPARECPYPGLAAFDEEQARWFFGRDPVIADLLIRLDERLRDGGSLVVVGPSGAGKSSLLRAGLLPALVRGALPAAGSAHWPRLLLTPTAHPVAALVTHLVDATGASVQDVSAAVAADPRSCAVRLRAMAEADRRAGTRLVVVVDQLEELFTLCVSDRERRAFLGVLTALAEQGPDGAGPAGLVVYGLRSDFYTPCANHSQLRTALQNGQLLLGPMSQSELKEAILFPARAADLDIEPGLVEVLLRDLGTPPADGSTNLPAQGYEAGRLPLLAHALRATWQQRHRHTLTVDGYQATGGIHHAVATTAERLFATLDPAQEQAARAVFLRLVKIGDNADDTRRRMPCTDLLASAKDPSATAAVIDTYTHGRLLTRHADIVEITHEALLHAWPRLRNWIDDDRAGHLIHQDLMEAAADWERAHRDTGMLYRGHRLEAAVHWATRSHQDHAGGAASAFLAASTRHARRSARIRRSVIAILTVLALMASAAAVVAFQQRSRAQAQRNEAVFNQIRAEAERLRGSQASLGAQLDLVTHRMRPQASSLYGDLITDANTALSAPLTGHAGDIISVAYSPDGRILASSGSDRTLRLWDMGDPAHPKPLGAPIRHTGWVQSVAFSPDGQTLASAGEGGEEDTLVRLWDLADPTHPTPRGLMNAGRFNRVLSAVFSPDGHTLAAAADDGVLLWDVADTARPKQLSHLVRGHTGTVWTVAYSPDGNTLASTGGISTAFGDGALLWDVSDPSRPELLGPPVELDSPSLAFSPDGRTLVGSADGAVRLWDVSDPRRLKQLRRPLRSPNLGSVAFSPDGRTLATAGGDAVQLWNLSSPAWPQKLGSPLGHTSPVSAVAFSPDGQTLATAGADGPIMLWTLPATVLAAHPHAVWTAAVSPDGRTLASGSEDRTVRLWDLSDPAHPKALSRPFGNTGAPRPKDPYIADEHAVISVAFSPDGRTLAADGADDTTQLWDVTDPSHPKRRGPSLNHDDAVSGWVSQVEFSPNGRVLAVPGVGGEAWLWNVTDPDHPKLLRQPPDIDSATEFGWAVAFSRDGRTLASGGEDGDGRGIIRLWDVTDPAHPKRLGQPLTTPGVVNKVAFSRDGRTLASGGEDTTVRLWDVTEPGRAKRLGQPLTTGGPVNAVAFSRDGKTLAGGGRGGAVQLWDMADRLHPQQLGELLGHTVSVTSLAFSPNGHTLVSTGEDFTVRVWEMNVDAAIDRICRITHNSLTRQQWDQHIPGTPFNSPCP
ncbi:NACHT and WD repeat domain-containing protein [Streptomyces cadmiisoli]|uniref:Novel STAND NTPase 1 domain-containing protein n=1 Tax=Streptomyces cadmiisoli TaxID=2184053 RepID=A0A2Z4JFJ5_9ACTN|nr:AAA family ATPase [Streptomyces cadmiisoli]AWW43463.1 hypothetical protein DN051_43725 [Streptomyces cadmiisoli]